MKTTNNLFLPVCIQLDYSLITSCLLVEVVIQLLNRNPLLFFCLPFWALRGKTYFQDKVFGTCLIDISVLPFRKKILDSFKGHNEYGVDIYLVSTSNKKITQYISGRLGIFTDSIVATNNHLLLKKIKERFPEGFVYVGGRSNEIGLIENAAVCYLVEPNASVLYQAKKFGNIETVFRRRADKIKIFFETVHIKKIWLSFLSFLSLYFVPVFKSVYISYL